ncbi:hypothetical protein SLEP1_g55724 [Rubroshorea leprosula]|uniref:Uncharacterized protein n=1 Tax=Rubroshorea leprosula TaxID=152421 RepID=A0AAV5MGD4_9ROSI|nr:hypothetical protein SLEP1_g55724 [Rubroshorea leprosula]
MANVRSSLPSMLRQLLAGEGAIGPSIKLDSEPPPKIKAFIDKVIQSPLQDIAILLSGFCWEYNKDCCQYHQAKDVDGWVEYKGSLVFDRPQKE